MNTNELRDAIVATRQRRKPVLVEVPEWGITLWLRIWTAAERAELTRWAATAPDIATKVGFDQRVAALSVCDESGNRLYTDEQAPELSALDGDVLDRLAEKALKINGLWKGAIDEATKSL